MKWNDAKRAGPAVTETSPTSTTTKPTCKTELNMAVRWPRAEEIWVYHVMQTAGGASESVCAHCGFKLSNLRPFPAPAGFLVFIPAFTRVGDGAKELKLAERPRGARFVVRCYRDQRRSQRIPEILGAFVNLPAQPQPQFSTQNLPWHFKK